MEKGKHKFMVKHAGEGGWTPGLRPDFEYRDLGIKDATGGEFGAHIIRIAEPEADHATGRHAHATGFQMIYVLQGQARFWFEDEGEIEVAKGDCFYQPDGLVHEALWMSADCELLEVTAPGEFETVEH